MKPFMPAETIMFRREIAQIKRINQTKRKKNQSIYVNPKNRDPTIKAQIKEENSSNKNISPFMTAQKIKSTQEKSK